MKARPVLFSFIIAVAAFAIIACPALSLSDSRRADNPTSVRKTSSLFNCNGASYGLAALSANQQANMTHEDIKKASGPKDTHSGCVEKPELVILLHGLMRKAGSMRTLARRLEEAGFETELVDYPSRSYPVEVLAEMTAKKIRSLNLHEKKRVHFVTHSMGGILVRILLEKGDWPGLGRVVMLAPPNGGSELSDLLRKTPVLWRIYGPAVLELSTGPQSIPRNLPKPYYDVGVIAGNRSPNPLFSLLIKGPDDGKVAVAKARFDGMKDFVVIRRTHSFIMNSPEAARQTIHFLRHGKFEKIGEKPA